MTRLGPALLLALAFVFGVAHADDSEPEPRPDAAPKAAPEKVRDFVGPRLGVQLSDPPAVFPAGHVMLALTFADAPAELLKDGARLAGDEELAAARPNLKVLSSPRLTCHAGQRANISVANQKTYVRAYDKIGKPITGTVSSGLVVDVRAFPAKDGKTIRLEVKVDRSTLRTPMAHLQTPRGPVGMPEVVHFETGFTLDVVAGKPTALVMPASAKGVPTLLVVQATPIKPFFEKKQDK